jgi:uncharacterized protein DUF6804
MKANSTIPLYIAWLIAAVMLVFAAAEKQPDNFYTILRWVCCAVFVYSAVISFQVKRMLWLAIFAVLAIVFNPIFPLPLDRSAWIVADWLSIGTMVIATFVIRKASKNSWDSHLGFCQRSIEGKSLIADTLGKAGWSWGCVTAINSNGRTLWIADAHRDDGKRFVVRADEKLTAFMELESAAGDWKY